jgi:hypothetical protein
MTDTASTPATKPPANPAPAPPPAATTVLSPAARRVWTRTRGLLLAAVILLAAAFGLAAVRSSTEHGRLDPRSVDPLGSHAIAALLADQGVSTRTVTTVRQAQAAARPDTTLVVAIPDLLTDGQQSRLRSAAAASSGRTVLVAPGPASTDALAPGVTADSAPSIDPILSPGCDLPDAQRAGPADLGGIRYTASSPEADSCYFSDGLPSLVRIPAADTTGDTVVIGAPDILFNDSLDKHGNASLALQLLGSRPHVVWYLPSLSDPAATDTGNRSFYDLIPSGWLWAAGQLTLAAVLAAAWRARRLGPLVHERLPVVIRASETAEGRARLYRKADARDRAAATLRTATRSRLAPLVGTPPAQAHTPEALLPALAARLHTPESPSPRHSPGSPQAREQHLRTLLFGPPPRDDTALIALAEHLDDLEGEVRHS